MTVDALTKQDTSPDTTQAGYFVIVDISGYTGFLTNNELAHAQSILAELTQLLIERLSAGPTNAGVQGRRVEFRLGLDAYRQHFAALPG